MSRTEIDANSLIAETFWDVQDDIVSNAHSEYWLSGGRGSTKSSFISIEIVLGIIQDHNANALVLRRYGNYLRGSVFNQIMWAIDMLGFTSAFRFHVSPMEIVYTLTGQKIIFSGSDDPMKIKSIKPTRGYFKYLWFEELTEFDGMEDIRSIKQSAFRGVDHAITFYSYNPPRSIQSWVNQEAMQSPSNRYEHQSTYLDVPAEWLGNEFIEEAEIVKQTNERAYRNEYLGEITGAGGQVFDNLELREITDDEIKSFDRFYNGLDFGFAVDPDAFSRWYFDRKRRVLYAVDEFYGAKNPLDALAGQIKSRILPHEYVTCDSADPRMIEELRRRGIRTVGAKKGPGSVEHGMRWLQDLAQIVIDKNRTPNIAKEFSLYEYERDRRGNFLSVYPDKDNHEIDSSRYALETVINMRTAKTSSNIY